MPDGPGLGGAGSTAVFAPLRSLLGERFSTGQAIRDHHSHGEGLPAVGMPDGVAFPVTNEEVAAIVAICRDAVVPIVGFGAGTSLEGHVAAVHGGICVDFSTMNAILEVSPEALDCRVQAGVTWQQLNAHVRSNGLFFPVDPGAEATLAGMAATRASGTMAVRYGTMRRNVLGLAVVTADGRLIRTGGRARKSAAGLDLTRLFVGSEGTLGLITELQLRLYGLPEAITAAVCQFETLRGAIETVVAALQFGVPLARVELMNALQMLTCIRYAAFDEFEPKPTLFLEFHGSPATVRDQVETMQALCAEGGGAGFRFAEQPEDRTRLWKARHDNYYACMAFAPGKKNMGTDACVPISALADCILETEADIAQTGLIAPIVGHVGDGGFHLGIMFDPDDPEEARRAEALARRTGERAIRFGGTCTGEHGIGLHRRDLLDIEHGEAVAVMRAIKRTLDPLGIMNPGKMLNDDGIPG
ncbi:MAG: FAD-linked oxidase C-terminal domain-containing protein [Devosia sp.]|nr:FAD-linked oxidase C-terminal domain-containing protein [Devosia sp.]